MAFGDYLRDNIVLLSKATTKKIGPSAFWKILRDIAVQDILAIYPSKIDSDTAVPIYYCILNENIEYIPKYFLQSLPSNNQPRYRVIVRNIFTSNAYHTDGLANQSEIKAYKEINEYKKGLRIVYKGGNNHVNK